MLKSFRLALAATSLCALAPAAAAVSPAAAISAERPSTAEAAAFVRAYSPSDVRRAAELSMLRKDFLPGLRRQAEMAELLDTFPALGPAMVGAMESQIDVYIAEFEERFFPRATAIVEQSLSRADTLALTRFYRAPLGRKALQMMAMNLDGGEVVDRALKNEAVDEGLARRQIMRSAYATIGQLSADERNAIVAFAQSPEATRLRTMLPALRALQVELMNKPGPKFRASSEAAMKAAFKRVTGIDLPANK